MKIPNRGAALILGLLAVLPAPAFGTITIVSMTPSQKSPQPIGKTIVWEPTATDSNAGPLTFQFNITPPGGALTMVKDFNVGQLSSGTWTAYPFIWVLTGIEGTYKIQVVAKDFVSGESASKTVLFHVNTVVTGSTPVVEKTANPLVALFSAPSCAAGSEMRVSFQEQSGSIPATVTNWVNCHPPASMTFEIAGMYPSTTYNMYSETGSGGNITNGPSVSFTTAALPKTLHFPKFTIVTAAADSTYPVLLHNSKDFGPGAAIFPDLATDLQGNVIWYYSPNDKTHSEVLTRPLQGGGILGLQNDLAWNPKSTDDQFLRQMDLAGNLVRETNVGAIAQQLVALGAADGGPCNAISSPAPIGSACVGAFHHDAIESLPNGYTAALMDIEKIFPAGTQGDTSGLPVDIIGDMIVVLDANWKVAWYWDAFDPKNGGNGYAQLPVSQAAILGETCESNTPGCPPVFLLGSGIAPLAHDWLHANSLYYWPAPQDGNTTGGDIVWSSRHQDAVFKIDYQDGNGSGAILWAMGSNENGHNVNFSFVNIYNDPWPWFSHQHDVGIENGGAGPMTIFDNGNTRISSSGLGSAKCKPYDCNSRGMAVTFSEISLTVTPVVSFDLGGFSTAMGSAELLDDGNFFFENPIVFLPSKDATVGYSQEIGASNPAPQVGPADMLLDIVGPQNYRAWQMLSFYNVPAT